MQTIEATVKTADYADYRRMAHAAGFAVTSSSPVPGGYHVQLTERRR